MKIWRRRLAMLLTAVMVLTMGFNVPGLPGILPMAEETALAAVSKATNNDAEQKATGNDAAEMQKLEKDDLLAASSSDAAYIGDQGYATLQKAVDAANAMSGNVTIELQEGTHEGDILVRQTKGVNLTIAGSGEAVIAGMVTISGRSDQSSNETLSFENIIFDAVKASNCVLIPNGKVGEDVSGRYSHNLTFSECTFKASKEAIPVLSQTVGIKQETAGCVNWTIEDCTFDKTLHSMMQVKGVGGQLEISGCEIYSQRGMSLDNSANVEISGCTIDVKKYGIRMGANAANVADETIVLTDNIIKTSSSSEGALALRGTACDTVIEMEDNTVDAKVYVGIDGSLALTTGRIVDKGGNTWRNGTFAEGTFAAAAGSGSEFSYCGSLEKAVEMAEAGDTVKPIKNVTLEAGLKITAKNVVLDLDGFTIEGNENAGTQYLLRLENGADVTIKDSSGGKGKMIHTSSHNNPATVIVLQSSLKLEKGTIVSKENKTYGAVYLRDAEFTMTGGAIEASDALFGIVMFRDANNAGGKTTVNIEDGSIVGGTYGLLGNGTHDGTVVAIKGGSITAVKENGCAIFHPQEGDLTISGGEFTGSFGVQYCGAGKVDISNGTFTATAPYTEFPSKDSAQGDGSANDGAALSLVSRGGGYQDSGKTMDVTISGGTFISEHNAPVAVYRLAQDPATGKWLTNGNTSIENYLSSLTVKGGTFEGDERKPVLEIDPAAEGAVNVSGGIYDQEVKEECWADGHISVPLGSGKHTVINLENIQMSIVPESSSLLIGETAELKVEMNPPLDTEVSWESSDRMVASVDADGRVTAAAEGTAVITASAAFGKERLTASCEITVTDIPAEVEHAEAEDGSISVQMPDKEQMTPPDKPADAETVPDVEFDAAVEAAKNAVAELADNEAVNGEGAVADIGQAVLEAGILEEHEKVQISLEQELQDVEFAAETVKDGEGNVIGIKVVPHKLVFDVSAYKIPMTEDDKPIEGLKEALDLSADKMKRRMFTFRLPVPSSVEAGYANVTHEGDGTKQYTIQQENGHKYITVSTWHLSLFEVTFTNIKMESGGHSSGGGSGSVSVPAAKWIQDSVGWWYRNSDGTWPSNTWIQLTWNNKADWYRFNEQGYMVAGWFTDGDGNRYFLHNQPDGTQGHMYTGWHLIDGKWYYFRENAGGPLGSLLVSGTSPEGYQTDAGGACAAYPGK